MTRRFPEALETPPDAVPFSVVPDTVPAPLPGRASIRLLSAALMVLTALATGCEPAETGEAAPGIDAARSSSPASPSSVDAGWMVEVQRRIAADEYAFIPARDALRAYNRAHRIDVRFDADGVHLRPSPDAPDLDPWQMDLAFTAWGREGAMRAIEPVDPALGGCLSTGELDAEGGCLRRLEYLHDGLTGWWENRPDGLEQGWTLEEAPPGDGPLMLELSLDGAQAALTADGAALALADGRLRYHSLAAWDARGEPLPAWMALEDHRLRIRIDDRDAAWPITVDPLLNTAAWTVDGENQGGHFGVSLSAAGDVNGDGYGDVVVGAYGVGSKGKAYLYLGSSAGLSTAAAWDATGENAYDGYGYAVTATDVDGDGFSDVLVASIGYSNNTGKVYLYRGSSSGLSTTDTWAKVGGEAGDRFGYALSAAGDVNADGYGDVIVGAYSAAGGTGRAYVFLGSSTGPGSVAIWTVTGESSGSNYGYAVSSAGDVNGDGYSDVVVGASAYNGSTGRAYVYLGRSGGLNTSTLWTGTGEGGGHLYGYTVAQAGDVNGDGYGDVVVGARGYGTYAGKAYLYLGKSTGLTTSSSWSATGEATYNVYASSLSSAGDVNGDGYADVVVGAYGFTNDTGKAYLYLGKSTGLSTTTAWTTKGETEKNAYGITVSSAGDVNGDGHSDVLVAATAVDNYTGRAYLYLGAAAGLATGAAASMSGPTSQSNFGGSVSSAGDVNGDGYADVIVGAGSYVTYTGKAFVYLGKSTGLTTTAAWSATGPDTRTGFGWSVSSAGDTDGDGYDDVIVGAYQAGKAYAFLGSATGLGQGASWLVSGPTGSAFGISVSSAGDVNGDNRSSQYPS